ncbi:MAG TPA: class I SAM-dependent methyltransferase [Terracidiphilus sp.]|nr:class I SAM-dependent methyltransferase [Terracidiphilus sp.]
MERLLARNSVGRILRTFMRPQLVSRDPLDVRQAYSLWSSTFAQETLTRHLEDELARRMLQGLPHAHLLDAGCGVGDRIRNLPGAVGIDQSPEMVAAGGLLDAVVGDIREMPFASGEFDMVWCRLVLGHLCDPVPAVRELGRVCMPGGYVFVTDMHPDAILAGHRRTFTDQAGVVHEVEHYVHTNYTELALRAGLKLAATRDAAIGSSARDFYIRGIGRRAYIRDFGLKLVSAYLFRRPEDSRSQASLRPEP